MKRSAANPGKAWHPLRALTQTDGGLTTCFHSFYALEKISVEQQQQPSPQVRVILRVPEAGCRKYVKDLENILIYEFLTYARREEEDNKSDGRPPTQLFGTFSFTLYNSKRYIGFWKSDNHYTKFLVGVSVLPLYTVSRLIFAELEMQEAGQLVPILSTLCEMPILPGCGLQYSLRFPTGGGVVPIEFSAAEQLDDGDIFMTAMQVLNPRMLILAWESLLLERHVLVVSSHPALLAPCCEFLKRLVLPCAFVGSYVPYLLDPEFIEAPVPYLQGISTQRLHKSGADLSDVVVVDLDAGMISIPSSETGLAAPPSVLSGLLHDLNPLWSKGVAAWVGRADDTQPELHPTSPRSLANRANAVTQIFIQQNIALLSARNCFIRAFSRRPAKSKGVDIFGHEVDTRLSSRVSGELDICYNVSPGGRIKSGALLLLQSNKRSIQVWVESDSTSLAVYRYEDELPMLSIASADIHSIVGIPQEPEGHIFEIVGQSTFRFQAADPEARLKWISLVDSVIQGHREKESLKEARERDPHLPREKNIFGFGETHDEAHAKFPVQSAAAGSSSSSSSSANHSPSAGHKHTHSHAHVHTHSHGHDAPNLKYYNTLVSCVGNSVNSLRNPFALSTPVLPPDEEEEMMTAFRTLFLKTQMVAFLDAQIERGEGATYETLFEKRGSPLANHEIASSCCVAAASEHGQALIAPESRISSVLASYVEHGQHFGEEPVSVAPAATQSSSAGVSVPTDAVSAKTVTFEDNRGIESAPAIVPPTLPTPSSPPASASASASASACSKCGQEVKRRPSGGGFLHFFLPARRECEVCAGHSPSAQDAVLGTQEPDEATLKRRAFEEAKRESSAFLARVALSHQACEDELHGGIMDARIEAAADLVQYFAKVQRGEVPLVPISIQLAADSEISLPSPSNPAMDSTGLFDGIWSTVDKYAKQEGAAMSPLQQVSLAARTSLLNGLSEQLRSAVSANTTHMQPCLRALLGQLYEANGSYDSALDMYAGASSVDQERVMTCLVVQLVREVKPFVSTEEQAADTTPSAQTRCAFVYSFLSKAMQLSPKIALQAYRLIAQLVHRHTISKMLEAFADDPQEQQKQNQILQAQLEELSPFLSRCGLAGKTEENGFATHRHRESFMRSKRPALRNEAFSLAAKQIDASILNETYVCSSSVHASDPCKLSHFLVSRLNELVVVYCQTEGGSRFVRRTSLGTTKIAISQQGDGQVPIREIRSQSAFQDFEIQVCELQKSDLSRLSTNAEKIVFWVNIYNCLCMHGILVRGSPGSNKFERFAFMKIKYRIGPHLFSLLDIEHGMLRSASAKPSSFALLPLTPFSIFSPISEKDPRKAFALTERVPLVNFVLFTASNFSPPLSALLNSTNVQAELGACAREYIRANVRVRRSTLTIVLPCLFYLYWSDFGDGKITVKSDVVKLLLKHAPSPLREALEDVVKQPTKQSAISPPAVSDGGPLNGLGLAVKTMVEEKSRANQQYKFLFDPLSWDAVVLIHSPG